MKASSIGWGILEHAQSMILVGTIIFGAYKYNHGDHQTAYAFWMCAVCWFIVEVFSELGSIKRTLSSIHDKVYR
jgi:hypothetical protein